MERLFRQGEYEAMVSYLLAYQRGGDMRRWDDFRHKIPDDLLTAWGTVLIECRRNGFVNPHVFNGEIVWDQILDNGSHERRNADYCTLCERDCKCRELIDSGETKRLRILNPGYHEKPPCWEKVE